MSQEKDRIKNWLKENKKTREWLAEKCYVTKPTVDGWFRSAGIIPTAKLALIRQLMSKSAIQEFGNPPGLPETELKNKLFITLDPAIQTILETQAHMNGMNLTAYCSLILERAADHEYEFLNDIIAMFEKKWQDSKKEEGE